MWSGIWPWLQNEANQKALALIGGLFAFLWSVGWGVFTYKYPPSPNAVSAEKKKSPDTTTVQSDSADPESPSDRPILKDTEWKPQALPPAWQLSSILDGNAFRIWGIGIALALGSYFSWLAYFYQPTVITDFKVCRGEFVDKCPQHDIFVGCSDPRIWASNACLKYKAFQISSSSGNMCGYSVWNFSCSQKVTQ
jgi:hypothetical protein